jgi:hypothetical protein
MPLRSPTAPPPCMSPSSHIQSRDPAAPRRRDSMSPKRKVQTTLPQGPSRGSLISMFDEATERISMFPIGGGGVKRRLVFFTLLT